MTVQTECLKMNLEVWTYNCRAGLAAEHQGNCALAFDLDHKLKQERVNMNSNKSLLHLVDYAYTLLLSALHSLHHRMVSVSPRSECVSCQNAFVFVKCLLMSVGWLA